MGVHLVFSPFLRCNKIIVLWIWKSRLDRSIFYADFLDTTNNPIPRTDSTTGIIQENVWAPARIRLVDSIGIISPPTGPHGLAMVSKVPSLTFTISSGRLSIPLFWKIQPNNVTYNNGILIRSRFLYRLVVTEIFYVINSYHY